ncbi:unnamed protein product [Schistocephalus solidus]|uniref:Ubiquinone biosynthesis protein n=1 Tax=Schistocephalus solidus TaxID=70667 RepID=A0A183TGT8_SCHSO|nr:unnamed protein product [Schistocephalus solidus]
MAATGTVSTAGNGVISSDSEYSSSSDSNFTVESEDLETLCEKALDAAIQFVPQYGWTREALEAACSAENLPPGLHSLAMPRGGIDLVTHFYECQNHLLAEELARWRAEEPESATSSSRTVAPNRVLEPGIMRRAFFVIVLKKTLACIFFDSFGFKAPPPFATKAETDAFLRRAIQYRLRSIEKVLPYWPQAMGLLSLPQNVPAAIALEAQLVDEIWAQAGDRSVDVRLYTSMYSLSRRSFARLFYSTARPLPDERKKERALYETNPLTSQYPEYILHLPLLMFGHQPRFSECTANALSGD